MGVVSTPLVPDGNALLQDFHMVWISHLGPSYDRLTSELTGRGGYSQPSPDKSSGEVRFPRSGLTSYSAPYNCYGLGGPVGWSSACCFKRVKTVSNPTPAEMATRTTDINWILSFAVTTVAEGAKTPGAPTNCGMRYAMPTTSPATAPRRSDVLGAVSSAPQMTDRTS